jgi:hypothetical protein
MDLVDRLISAAGAAADAADRFVGLFRRRPDGGRGGAGPTLVAGCLGVLAILFLAVGLEAMDPATPRSIGPGVGTDPSFGDHAYVSVTGQVASEYGGHFFDVNGDGVQDPGEADADFVYVLADPATRDALTVVSTRPPSDVYRTSRTGTVREDPSFIAEDLPFMSDDIDELGIHLDRSRYVDARVAANDASVAFDFKGSLPEPGTTVTLDGGVVATWTYLCPTGDDCDETEAESFDLLVYDVTTRQAVLVVTDDSPEWTPMTFSGMLRREEHAVSEALDPSTFDLERMDVLVSPRYLLEDGTAPVSPVVAWALAAICALAAAAILVGLAGGYLIYRRWPTPLPAAARTLAVGDRIPVRATGWLRTPSGVTRVREAQADLVRFAVHASPATEPASAPDLTSAPPTAEPASTLIVERRGRPEGVSFARDEVSRLTVGDVFPLRGRRPALRATVGTGPLVLSFETTIDRDRAVAEVLGEAGQGSEAADTIDDAPARDAGPAREET